MYKTHFFSEDSTEALQEKVNEWLEKEKQIFVVGTNMTSVAGGGHVFYIIYEVLKGSDVVAEEMISDQKTNVDPLTKVDFNIL